MKTINKGRLFKVIIMLVGVFLNVTLSYIVYSFELPLYLDSIGTIGVAAIAGVLPGFIVGLSTNIICGVFNPMSIYYSLLSMIMALCAAQFSYRNYFKKKSKILYFIFIISLSSGVLGTLFQYLLLNEPQFFAIRNTAKLITEATGINYYVNTYWLNFLLNFVDKGITTLIALFIVYLFPEDLAHEIWNSNWRQNPLAEDELQEITKDENGESILQKRVTNMLVIAALSMTAVMAFFSIRLYFNNTKNEYTSNAYGAAKLAAAAINPARVDDFISKGLFTRDYEETRDELIFILDSFPGLQYMSVFRVEETGYRNIFFLDKDAKKSVKAGELIAFNEDDYEYIPRFFAGEEILPEVKEKTLGWLINCCYPVKDENGKLVCYVGTQVTLDYLSDFVQQYLIKVLLIFAGFFLMILAAGIWASKFYLVFPIRGMVACTNSFVYDSDNQTVAQDNIKKIKSLDIQTGDEVENLYHAICKMTEDTAQQMNDIRYKSKTINQMQSGLIITMADMVENRDSDTGNHIQKTADYVKIILEGLNKKGYYASKLTPKYISDVEMSAPLHDIGKINIPDAVLNKPGKLTDEEFEIMKGHTTAGKKIMEKAINTVQGESYLKEARNMAAYHHEKWDGSGYPEGLKGEVIPLSARIMAVADVFDALTSKRVYKDAMPFEQAMDIIKKDSGTHFDPKCVEVFVDAEEDVKRILKKYRES